jgi:hypothetical protein
MPAERRPLLAAQRDLAADEGQPDLAERRHRQGQPGQLGRREELLGAHRRSAPA